MKRRSLIEIMRISISALLLSLLVCGFVQGQKRRGSSVSECKEGQD